MKPSRGKAQARWRTARRIRKIEKGMAKRQASNNGSGWGVKAVGASDVKMEVELAVPDFNAMNTKLNKKKLTTEPKNKKIKSKGKKREKILTQLCKKK